MAKAKLAVGDVTPRGDAPASEAGSPARDDLADLLRTLRDAERKAMAARAPVVRLEAEIADEAAARALLGELDTGYAARIAAWASTEAGAAPEPVLEARREAEATLKAATLKAEAARDALTAMRRAVAATDARVGELKARTGPAVAAVLREEGTWLAAEYWRRYAELEQVRRELAALDQVLIADFPTIHAPTGRVTVRWLSPVKLSAADALDAAEAARAGLDDVARLTRDWRARAEALSR